MKTPSPRMALSGVRVQLLELICGCVRRGFLPGSFRADSHSIKRAVDERNGDEEKDKRESMG